MRILKYGLCIGLIGLFFSCSESKETKDEPILTSTYNSHYAPEKYVAYKTNSPISIDGDLKDKAWEQAPWTNLFVDIEGDKKPSPTYPTKAKMLWDSNYFYFAFEIVEPHIWATLTERDAVIFKDNDIEIFIDPNGDTHHYYEYEMNAFNTQWDLLLTKPYREPQMHVLDAWTIRGIKSAVKIYGTLNNSLDTDNKWTVEVALPWSDLEEANDHNGIPKNNETWKVNFSRVNWDVDILPDGTYKKSVDPKTGKTLPEHNWVWSPQGVIAMHQPETWGLVQFSHTTEGTSSFVDNGEDHIKWMLRQVYYRQNEYKQKFGKPAKHVASLALDNNVDKKILSEITITTNGKNRWEASVPFSDDYNMIIQWDGKVWKEKK